MPLNTLRLNHAPSSHPNDRIVFFKPLPRSAAAKTEYDAADTFLRAIAAQCLPIMKKQNLSVTTLAEHEPNREFIGRNFNNGEIIELVLRTRSGGWVSFQMVQLVMMHELAHNVHMNHSKHFWQTRNLFTQEMKELWAKRYTGEGFWGSGNVLQDLTSVMGNNIVPSEELQDIEVCGGSYRSRRRKRKAGPDLTWKEKRDRRIEKKFGKNGQALGEDETQRLRLEIGRKGPIGAKPRVAGSKRGRELRAAAALARFSANKQEADELEQGDSKEHGDETDEDDYEEAEETGDDALDSHGQVILDGNGKGMIRVCGDEDGSRDNDQIRQELEELGGLEVHCTFHPQDYPRMPENDEDASPQRTSGRQQNSLQDKPEHCHPPDPKPACRPRPVEGRKAETNGAPPNTIDCPVCTMSNEHLRLTCLACAHVIDKAKAPGHWLCQNEACREGGYVNAGDYSFCGVCGSRKNSE